MTVMLTVCYINRQPGRGHHYSDTNAVGESAASKNMASLDPAKVIWRLVEMIPRTKRKELFIVTKQYESTVLSVQCIFAKKSRDSPHCLFMKENGSYFDLILHVPSTIFQLCRDGSSWVEPILS